MWIVAALRRCVDEYAWYGACECHVPYFEYARFSFFSVSCLFLPRLKTVSLPGLSFFVSYLFLCFVSFFLKKKSSPLSQPMQGSDFDDDEFDVGTLRYHPSNTFRPQFGIEEDTFSEYSVDQPVSRRPLRSRPPIDFSSNWQHSHPPSFTSSSTAYSSLGPIVAPKAASATRSPRFSPEDIASLTIPELCHNAHYCELRDNHDYTSRVLAQYLGKDLRVGEHRAPRGVNGSRVPDVYRSTLLIHYEVYSLNHIPQHYHHMMRTPRHHLWRQAIRYPSFRKVHNSMQQLSPRSLGFSTQ